MSGRIPLEGGQGAARNTVIPALMGGTVVVLPEGGAALLINRGVEGWEALVIASQKCTCLPLQLRASFFSSWNSPIPCLCCCVYTLKLYRISCTQVLHRAPE